jgi:hypothetical protein
MSALIDWLNANAGAVTAAATAIYAVVTLLLLFEARRARQLQDEAALTLSPTPWGDGLYLALRLENYGPAVARDVRLRYWYVINGQTVEGTDVSYADPVFGPSRRRDFLPGAAGDANLMLTALAEQRHVLHAELAWTDDRLSLLRRRQRHSDSWTWATEDLRRGFYTAHPLTDKELVPTFERKADKVIGELEKIRREAEYPRQRRQSMEWRQQREAEAAEREAETTTTTTADETE